MKFLDEYRDGEAIRQLAGELNRITTRPWSIMEVCGGQTHSIMRHGIHHLIPAQIELLHGPGCPVCVTPLEMINKAHHIAAVPGVIFCSFGDMLRVPGTKTDLFALKARGADVRIVYSPLNAVEIAAANPQRQVVFFAIGFETTAPANAMAVWLAKKRGLKNFSVLVSQVLVPPILRALLNAEDNRVQGFLGPGHVCTVVGYEDYEPISAEYRVPIVITGFEPVDLLEGLLRTVRQLESGTFQVENQYSRAAKREGNRESRQFLRPIFEPCDRAWRGLGIIPDSGYRLTSAYSEFDAEIRFNTGFIEAQEPEICISGAILKGVKKPKDCPAFGTQCTPQRPMGATMVSSEGACSAYFLYENLPAHAD